MLKNPANAPLQLQYYLLEGVAGVFDVVNKTKKEKQVTKALRFIEQCPLKIKQIKIEGFV